MSWLYCLIFFLTIHSHSLFSENLQSAITYKTWEGRLGDQLLLYSSALYISWKYKLPLLYKPFAHSDQLKLSQAHLNFDEKLLSNYVKKVNLKNYHSLYPQFFLDLKFSNKQPILFETDFYPPFQKEVKKNKEFKKILVSLIKPIYPLDLVKIPSNRLSIAVHLRSRRNFYDTQQSVDTYPDKFPHHSFYISGIREIANIFKKKSLFIYIFTDDPYPYEIRDMYLKKLKILGINNDIVIECSSNSPNQDLHVIRDFFSMMKFDCLIRSDSHFSRMISLLSSHTIDITISHSFKTGMGNIIGFSKNKNFITNNLVSIRSKRGNKVIKSYIKKIQPEETEV